MDGTSSFIPKAPARGTSPVHTVKRVYILTYVAYLFFFGALVAAGATYAYSFVLQHKLTTAQTALAAQRNQFNQSDLQQVTREAGQLTSANTLLNQHVFVYTIFSALEKSTVRNVQLDKFSWKQSGPSDTYTLSFIASAPSVNDLLFQRATYMSSNLLKGAAFSQIEVKADTGSSNGPGAQSTKASFTVTKVFKATDLPLDPTVYTNGVDTMSTASTGTGGTLSAAASGGTVATSTSMATSTASSSKQ